MNIQYKVNIYAVVEVIEFEMVESKELHEKLVQVKKFIKKHYFERISLLNYCIPVDWLRASCIHWWDGESGIKFSKTI